MNRNKELEALERMYTNEFYDMSEEYDLVKKALTPPTADDVCKELDKWYIEATGDLLVANINDFTYNKKEKRFYKRMLNKPHQMTICRLDTNDCVQLREPLPPHLITMIGKFYESLEGEKNE